MGFSAQRRADQFITWVESGLRRARPADRSTPSSSSWSVPCGHVPVVTARPRFVGPTCAALMARRPRRWPGPTPPGSAARAPAAPEAPPRRRRSAASPSSASPRASRSRPRAPCRATPSTRSSRASRTRTRACRWATAAAAPTILANATDRLDEADALVRQGQVRRRPPDRRHLSTFTDQADRGSTCCSPTTPTTATAPRSPRLREFSASSLDRLAASSPRAGVGRDELIRAARTVAEPSTPRPAHRCPTAAVRRSRRSCGPRLRPRRSSSCRP